MNEDDQRELNCLRKEKRKLVARNKLQQLSNVCNRMGEILSRQGKYEEALQEHRDEETACVKLEDFLGVAIANRKIGECHSELGSYSEALEYQRKHLDIAVSLSNVVEEQRAWATIGRTHLYQAEVLTEGKGIAVDLNSDKLEALNCAEEAFLKSLDLCSRLQSNVEAKELAQMQGRLFLNLGLVLEQRGDLDGCSQFIQKAIHINKEHHLVEDLQRCHHSLCLLYKRNGQLASALSHVQEAVKAATKITDLEEECELHTLHGHICLLLSDFRGAKQVLKKTKKKMTALAEGRTKADAFCIWKTAAKLCAAEERLLCLESDDVDVRRTTYEKMGDLCCRVDNYEKALHFYHRSLELTEELDLGNMNLAPLYLSLAQTYCDTGQYDRATHYYQLELNCWSGNSVETCKTLLNIADCEHSDGKDYATLDHLYATALRSADEAKDERLVRRCLESLATVQSAFGESEAKAETLNRLEALAVDDDDTSTEECEGIPDDSSVPSDESSTDDEGPTTRLTQPGQSRRKRFRMRRNEKGETPLHRACIEGDVKLAKKLLDQSHPVNIRDYSGWLPLHEAANHDHAQIVELLLDHGAWINDRGGEHCDGITPLHDAASNGNVTVVRLLLERGASVLAKTSSGETVLGCLVKWQERAEDNTDSEILSDSIQLADELRDAMKSAAEKLQGVSGGNDESDAPRTTCEALISEDNHELEVEGPNAAFAAEDGWLVDDVRPAQRSRKRHRSNLSPVHESSTGAAIRRTNNVRTRHVQTNARVEKRPRTSRSAIAAIQPADNREAEEIEAISDEDDDIRFSPSSDSFPNEAIDPCAVSEPSCRSALNQDKTNPALLRIKVKILDKLLLVPAPSEETIGWLANEAAHRYYMLHGLRPVLSLSTKEGALLAVVDTVHHVISAEDEVIGTVESWDLPPLNERYVEACAALSENACKNVTDIFIRAKGIVCLRNLRLTVNRVRPICRALQCQYSLTELVLAGNRFGDDGLQFLSTTLPNLPGLQILDLSCNDITDKGVGHLANAVSSSNLALLRLKTLKLGYNPLADAPNLCTLFGLLKALEELHLQSCCDDERWPNNDALKNISRVTCLRHLNLSFNRLSQEQLINQLGPALTALPSLRRLDLRGVAASRVTARALCEALCRLFKDPKCELDELDLALCSLDDECLSSFADAVVSGRGVKLKFVDLSCNAGLLLSSSSSVAIAKSMAEDVRLPSLDEN